MDNLEDKEIVLEKIKKNIYQKITVTNKKSHIWQNFYEIRDYENKFQKYLICKDCDALFVYKTGRTGTSSLGRHTLVCHRKKDIKVYVHLPTKKKKTSKVNMPKVAATQDIKKNLLSNCILCAVKDIRPFEMFEGEGMIKFSQALIDIGAKYGNINSTDILPQASVVAKCAKEMADSALPMVLQRIKKLLNCGQHVAISTDSWANNHRQLFLSVTCHFINENWELKKVSLGCTELEQNTSSCLTSELLDFLLSLGFETEEIETKFTFVLSKSTGLDIESKEVSQVQPCVVHIINTILFHTFCETTDQPSDECGEIYNELHDQEFSDSLQVLFSSCINLISYIKSLHPDFISNLEMKSSLNTKYAKIMKLSEQQNKITSCLQAISEEHRLQNIDFTLINIISSFLEPFKIIMDGLQGENNCTIYGVLLFKMKLDSHLLIKYNDPPILRKLKKRAEIILKDKFTILLHHKIATFLCPKFKSLQFLSEPEREETYEIIQQKISELVTLREGDGVVGNDVKVEINVSKQVYNSSLLDFEEFSDNVYPSEQDVGTEFYSYLQTNIQCETSAKHIGGVDLLKFWKAKERSYPVLARLAKSILCVPAYSVVSEKFFESSNSKMDGRRNNMNIENLSTILILNTAEQTKFQV